MYVNSTSKNQSTAIFRSNYFSVVTSSMNNKIEYLVKYSVAPSPSRDYYGLKVLQDEVILYLWKISHGPHKAPIVYRAKLIEFDHDKSLQNEIHYAFGKHLLKYVKNIAEGNINTLLTLPKNLIGRISRYLKFTDILNLSSLSHIACEVFNIDSIWEILYKRDKKANVNVDEREKARIYGWKQLYKDRQMQTTMKTQKNLGIPIKFTNDVKTNKLSLRPTRTHTNTNDVSKSISKTTSTTNIMTKKLLESPSTNLATTPLSKTMSDTRFRTYTKNETIIPQNRNVGNTNFAFNVNEKAIKKENLIASKTAKTKRQAKNIYKYDKISDKPQSKSEKCFNKINNTSNTKSSTLIQQNKLKSTTSKTLFSKNVDNAKSSSDLTQNSHNRILSKTKIKPKKKIAATKSEIFNTDETLPEKPFLVEDGNFDLADLIEASLKNIRSPRNVFDYDFSCIQQSNATKKDTLKIKNESQNMDKWKQLKPSRNSIITNNLSNKMIRDGEILEKLSERSESFSETSNESLINDKKSLPYGNNKSSLLSETYMQARAELQQSLDWKRNVSVSSEDRWDSAVFQDKSVNSKKINNNDEKSFISRGPSKTYLLKANASNDLKNKKNIPAHKYSSKNIK